MDRRFNKRAAQLVEVQEPFVSVGGALGIMLEFFPTHEQERDGEIGALRLHMTPTEAISLAHYLTGCAHRSIKLGKPLNGTR
jgi:hypothetical protein